MDEFQFDCRAVSSIFSHSSMVYNPFHIIAQFITPILFVFYVLFGLEEVADAPESVLIVVLQDIGRRSILLPEWMGCCIILGQ